MLPVGRAPQLLRGVRWPGEATAGAQHMQLVSRGVAGLPANSRVPPLEASQPGTPGSDAEPSELMPCLAFFLFFSLRYY